MGALGNFGRSKARRIDPATIRITFADVAGIDEAKSELTEIVDFLRNPARFGRLGGRMPHGVLLSGAPGTGKTLLARAVAGEAHAAFFSMSASEFIEAIVGVGASRVRDLFAKAKEAAPSIIFIDELDAVGRSRQGSVSIAGSNDEREQTLNQILTEMDGFESVEAVVVLAATNRAEILDPALLRPGRFDRRVAVQPPDRLGRRQILEVHTRSIPLAAEVDLEALAATTPGMVGADLANLANEAALLAARRNHRTVQTSDFTDSLEKILLGAPRRIVLSAADRERTAYHEAGHALVGMLTPGADPVRKVSIIPRGAALGVTLSAPDDDQVSYTREDLLAKIKVALGGRVAEEVVFGTISTGAESDIDQVTTIARQMVGRWGMSDAIGFVRVLPSDGRGSFFGSSGESSEATQRVLDEEVRQLIETAHLDVTTALTQHRDRLETLAQALLKTETLDELDAYAAAQMPPRTPDAGASAAVGHTRFSPDPSLGPTPRCGKQPEHAEDARQTSSIPLRSVFGTATLGHVDRAWGPASCLARNSGPPTRREVEGLVDFMVRGGSSPLGRTGYPAPRAACLPRTAVTPPRRLRAPASLLAGVVVPPRRCPRRPLLFP